jgi:hypothetical protein
MRILRRHTVLKTLAFLGLSTLAAADAHAGFTQVNAPIHATELGHAAILSQTYGGTFSAAGLNFSSGNGYTALRLDDDGSAGDECWGNAFVSARAIARFAGWEQTLGVIDGDSGPATFHELFTVSGTGLNVAGSVTDLDLCGKTVRFARGGGGEMLSSLALDNVLAVDQMVSYKLLGSGGAQRYLLFFEDVGAAYGDSDRDFNDLVVELTVRPGVNAVPLPPAAWSALAVLLAGGVVGSRKRIRSLFA